MGKSNTGNTFERIKSVTNWQKCAEHCMDNSTCDKWTWISSNHNSENSRELCNLKSGGNTQIDVDEHKVSGVKSNDCKELGMNILQIYELNFHLESFSSFPENQLFLGREFYFTNEAHCYEFPLYGCEEGGCDYYDGIIVCQHDGGYIATDNKENNEMVFIIL